MPVKPRTGDQDDADAHEERFYFVENPDTARLSDLDTAIENNEAHLAAHPDCILRWLYQAESGNLRAARGTRTESREDLVRAVELLRAATADPQTSPDFRGKFLFNLGNLLTKGELAESFGNLSEGVGAYRQALELEFLEMGRGVLWSQSLDLRTDLAEIEEADPELAARLAAVREALDSPTSVSEAANLPPVAASWGLVPPDPVDPDWSAVMRQAQRISASGDRDGLYEILAR